MDKTEIREQIARIPQFELKIAGVKDPAEGWQEAMKFKAVVELGKNVPFAFVNKGYQLVQFKDVFEPILESLPDTTEGRLFYYGGMAHLEVFPGEQSGDTKFGLVIGNSVNKTSSVTVRFCIEKKEENDDGIFVTFPHNIGGFKQMHMGRVIRITQNYLQSLSEVQKAWGTIMEEFPKIQITPDNFGEIMENLSFDDRTKKAIKYQVEIGTVKNLWDVFVSAIRNVSKRKYKSPLHERKKLESITQNIFDHAVIAKLMG